MNLRRHKKHKDVSSNPLAETRLISGDTGVGVIVYEIDPYSIPRPALDLRLSVAEARALARRLLEEATKAVALGAPDKVGPDTPGAFFCKDCGTWLVEGGTVHNQGEHNTD